MRLALRLRALGVETTQDLLFLLPLRYEDRTRVVPLGRSAPGQRAVGRGRGAAHRGRVPRPAPDAVQNRRRLGLSHAAILSFHGAAAAKASRAACASAASARRAAGPPVSRWCIPNIAASTRRPRQADEHLTPIYPRTEGLTQGRLRQLVGRRSTRRPPAISRTGCRRRCSRTRICPACGGAAIRAPSRPRTRRWMCSSIGAIRRSGGSRSRSCSRISCR
jgi:RecG-like helicase